MPSWSDENGRYWWDRPDGETVEIPHAPLFSVDGCSCEFCRFERREEGPNNDGYRRMAPGFKADAAQVGEDHDLFIRWCKYYYRTEQFDQVVCKFKNEHGEAVPTVGEEMRLCSAFARKQLKELDLYNKPPHPDAQLLSFEGVKKALEEHEARNL